MSEQGKEARVHLLNDLRAGRTMCLLASDILEGLGEEDPREGSLSRADALYGLSGIVRSVARNLENAELAVGALE